MPTSWPPWRIAAERAKSRGRRVGTWMDRGWRRVVYRAFCSNPKCRMPFECARKQDAFEPGVLCPECSDGRRRKTRQRDEQAEFLCGLLKRERVGKETAT